MHTEIESSTPPASTDAERYMLDVIKRFHRSRCYMLLAIRRTERGGQRLFLTATEFRPQRRGARPEWSLVEWNVDELSICFRQQQTKAGALREVREAPHSAGSSSAPLARARRPAGASDS